MNKRIITATLIVSLGLIGYVGANTDTKEEKKQCTVQDKECSKKGSSEVKKECCNKSNETASCESKKATCSASEKKECSKSKKT